MIDSRAIIDPSAKIAEGVSIGPWTIIGPNVEIGEGTQIASHVVINQNAKIGRYNKIHSFASIAGDSQDVHYKGEEAWLTIGDHNTIREYCSINRGSIDEGKVTEIGNHNLLMASVHVAHDCKIGNHAILANLATLGGHVKVGDYAILGGATMVHQFCYIGAHAITAGCSGVMQDVLPYVLMKGDPASPRSINVLGLERREFSAEAILELKRAYKILFRRGYQLEEALRLLEEKVSQYPEVQPLVDAISGCSKRGIARP